MGDVKNGYQATPNATLEQQMMDACAPKNEREWWAFAEIGRLRAEVEVLKAENERQFTALNDWLYANGPNGWIDLLRHELAAMTTEVEALRADSERLTGERDVAIGMLAYWCVAVDQNGTGWDDWDEHYKDAMYRPCPIRELLDKEINAVRAAQGGRG